VDEEAAQVDERDAVLPLQELEGPDEGVPRAAAEPTLILDRRAGAPQIDHLGELRGHRAQHPVADVAMIRQIRHPPETMGAYRPCLPGRLLPDGHVDLTGLGDSPGATSTRGVSRRPARAPPEAGPGSPHADALVLGRRDAASPVAHLQRYQVFAGRRVGVGRARLVADCPVPEGPAPYHKVPGRV